MSAPLLRRLTLCCLAALLAACSAVPGGSRALTAYALPPPYIGSMSQTNSQYDKTISDMKRSRLAWNVRFQTIGQDFDATANDGLTARGVTRLVTSLASHDTLDQINSGVQDADITRFAKQMHTWQAANPGRLLIIRPLWEMNGNWSSYAYGGGHNGNTVAKYKLAWRRIRALMRRQFPSLPFLWCPNALLGGRTSYATDYVGNTQTEYVGFDSYNHSQTTGTWKTPDQVLTASVKALRAVTGKDIEITESATSEPYPGLTGVSKAKWFTQLGYWLKHVNYNVSTGRVGAYCYNNAHSIVGGKDNDYLIYDTTLSSGSASRSAWVTAMAGLP